MLFISNSALNHLITIFLCFVMTPALNAEEVLRHTPKKEVVVLMRSPTCIEATETCFNEIKAFLNNLVKIHRMCLAGFIFSTTCTDYLNNIEKELTSKMKIHGAADQSKTSEVLRLVHIVKDDLAADTTNTTK